MDIFTTLHILCKKQVARNHLELLGLALMLPLLLLEADPASTIINKVFEGCLLPSQSSPGQELPLLLPKAKNQRPLD
jgi:hypothetical protein